MNDLNNCLRDFAALGTSASIWTAIGIPLLDFNLFQDLPQSGAFSVNLPLSAQRTIL